MGSYARFYQRHGLLLGPWLFDHVSELRATDGTCDLAAARLLLELTLAKGGDWVFMSWMNGDLSGLLSARQREVDALAAKTGMEAHGAHAKDIERAFEGQREIIAIERHEHEAERIALQTDIATLRTLTGLSWSGYRQ